MITAGSLRKPRSIVKLSGTRVDGWSSWSVVNNSFYESDTFRVSFLVSALPKANDANWIASQAELFVEIFVGFAGAAADGEVPDISQMKSLIYGRVDEVEYNPTSFSINLTGRDLTAVFIDNKATADYLSKTSSDVATLLAQKHGLTPVVTQTTGNIGVFYKHDQMRLQPTRSEWDELTYLARKEGFVVYVKGMELHFEPEPTETADPYVITWTPPNESSRSPSANVVALSFLRALTVAKGVTVTVRSASLTKKTAVVQSYPSAAHPIQAGKSSPFGQVQNYYYTMGAGHTPDEVEEEAERRYREIISHEMKMRASLPADDALAPGKPIRVTGLGNAFDQIYFTRLIQREMSIDEGYRMTIDAQNTSPDQQA